MNDQLKWGEGDFADKITTLLTKANDPASTPAEAEMFSRKAEQLMVKWGISDAELDAKRRGQKRAGEKVVEKIIKLRTSDARAVIRIGFAIARGFGNVRCLQASVYGSSMHKNLYLIGFESDVDRAIDLFESLQVQALNARSAWWTDLSKFGMAANEKFLARRQFVWSIADAIEKRLREFQVQGEQEVKGTSTALVLVDRKAKVDEWLGEKYPKLGKNRSMRTDYAGAAAGAAAGRSASLGGNQVGTGSAGQLS